MSKVKSKVAKEAPKVPDVLSKVKDAGITKPAQNMKAKSKELAQQVAAKEERKARKIKEPTPESSESESDVTSDESEEESPTVNGKVHKPEEESESESESSDSSANGAPAAIKANGVNIKKTSKIAPAVNGKKHAESESESAEELSESSDEEAAKPSSGSAPPPANTKSSDEESEESEDKESAASDSDSSEESDSDEKQVAKNSGSVKVAEAGKPTTVAHVEAESSDEDEDKDDSASGTSADSSGESDSEEEVETKEVAPPKRKAQEPASPVAKKAKLDETNNEVRGRNLFVGNLSWNVDEAWLKEEFEAFGEVSGARIIMDRNTGRSKGFGYVDFVNAADAAKAHSKMSGYELDGRKLNVDFSNGPTNQQNKGQARAKAFGDVQSPPSDTLFIGNLSFDAGQDAISTAFQEHGTVLGIRLPTDRESGQPKGYGYITFSSVDEAKAALEAMQGVQIEGRPVRLDFSQPRPERSDSFRGGRGGFGGRGGRGGGGRGRGGFSDRGGRGGRPNTTNRGGFGDFSGKKTTF